MTARALRLLLPLALLLATQAEGQLLRIYYPDIEQGSSTLVVSPTGKAMRTSCRWRSLPTSTAERAATSFGA